MDEQKQYRIPQPTKKKYKPYKEPTFGFLINIIPAIIWALVITDQALPWELTFCPKFNIRSIVYCCIEDSLYYICSYDSEYNHVCWTYMGSNQSDRSCLAEDYLESHNSNLNRRK